MFDGVRVLNATSPELESYHTCEGVESGVALGDTYPVPPCFKVLVKTKIYVDFP